MSRQIHVWIVGATFALLFCFVAGCQTVPLETPSFFPSRKAQNYEVLVSATWVKALLDFDQSNQGSLRPPTYNNDHFVILEASWVTLEQAKDYRRGHIPGAIHLNTDELENGYPRWRLRSDAELQQVMGRHGISPRSTVIVYGRQVVAAARVWWILKYLGMADVRLLDGGFEMWEFMNYPRETMLRTPVPATFDTVVNTNLIASTEYVRSQLGSQQIGLADARSEAEFNGEMSGYSYMDCKGRIPTSIAIGDATDGSPLYTGSRGRLRDPAAIEALWRDQGILPSGNRASFDREVIFYCGGGWRSSLAFFYAWLLGHENIRNYSDGWSGWSTVYTRDPTANGSTPGWKQQRTSNPIYSGVE